MLPNTLDFKLGLLVGSAAVSLGLFVGYYAVAGLLRLFDSLRSSPPLS